MTVPTTASPTEVLPEVELDCSTVIDRLEVMPDGYASFANAVALRVDRLELPPVPNAGERYYGKNGLLIRAGRTTTLRVATGATGDVGIGWGGGGRWDNGAVTLRVPACPAGSGSARSWLVFAGGYYLSEPTCVRLTIASGATTETARIPVGTPCP